MGLEHAGADRDHHTLLETAMGKPLHVVQPHRLTSATHRHMYIRMQMNDQPSTTISEDLWSLFRMHAELCKALANEHRLAILNALGPGEMCVGDLAVALGMPVHKVSQHLRVLKERLLVRPRKDGKTVYYSITNPLFIEGCALIRRALIEQHQAAGRSLLAAELLEALRPPPARTPVVRQV